MKNIYLTLLFVFFGLFLSCKNTKAKEPESFKTISKTIKSTETKELFSLVKSINNPEEPFYKTIYNDYSISINSNTSNQELIFEKGNIKISKVLKFYYEYPEIVFHLYKSSFDNFVILIEGRDYYSSAIGVYYLDNKLTNISEIDDTLSYNQDDPESKGFKSPMVEILKNLNILKCKFYLGNKFLYNKDYKISTEINTVENNALENNKATNDINQYLNNKDYFIKTFDINKDGIDDKIVSHNRYQGDELLIFLGEKGTNFKFVLKTVNFSIDGGNQISDITKTEQGFNIITLFPDRGSDKEIYHITFENNSFILKGLEKITTSWQDDYKETCTISNLDFNLNRPINELLNILSKSEKNCKKTKL